MTGSLQIKNNKYYAVLNMNDSNGKRRQKWISTELPVKGNKKRANEVLIKLLEDYEECDFHFDNLLLVDYLYEWLERAKSNLELSTYAGYLGNLKNHIAPYFQKRKIRLLELKPYLLEDFYAYLMVKKGLSAQTVRHNHRVISKALNDAMRHDMIPSNPAQRVTLPKIKKYVGSFLNPEQLITLFSLFQDSIIYEAVAFTATYGLRRSETLGLCWDKVDFLHDQFTVARAMIQKKQGAYYLKECTKNESSYRTLPLTKDMKDMLLELKRRRETNKAKFGNGYAENDFVFTWEDGSPITPNYLTRMFHKKISQSDLPAVRLHDLRHSTASNLLASGFSVVEVQHWLGHSEASTTLNFYSHIDSSSKNNIKNALENLLPLEKC